MENSPFQLPARAAIRPKASAGGASPEAAGPGAGGGPAGPGWAGPSRPGACLNDAIPPARPPSMPFTSLGLPAPLSATLMRLGFVRPTPVQERAIPLLLGGGGVIASAETGSGKTAAFLLPIFARFLGTKRPGGTRALVLVPTRELAVQVRTVALDLSEG